MRRIRVSIGVTVIVIVAGLACGCFISWAQGVASDPGVLRFDAKWWQNANADEQQGFIYGYMDCRQPPKSANASTVDYQNAVSEMMKSQKMSDPNAVAKAIEHAWTTLKSRPIPKGAEVFAGPHGFLDGEWWGGFEGRPWPPNLADADRGYLEGYLECAAPPATVKAVQRYQTALNQHYASGRYEHDKIADVLQKLLKSRTTSQK